MRHTAHQGQRLLSESAATMSYLTDRDAYAAELEAVAARLTAAAEQIRGAETAKIEHFGS